MPRYLAIFLGTPEARAASGWDALDETTRKAKEREGIQAWKDWMQKHQGALDATGSPLGKTLRVDRSGVSPTKNGMAAWVAVNADSHEAAARMFEGHPHFTVFPGESVEVMECLQIPE